MYRKMFSAMICLMLLGGTYFVPKVRADESDKKTIVTVNEPIQVPGKVLPAGTYVYNCWIPTIALSLQFTTLTGCILSPRSKGFRTFGRKPRIRQSFSSKSAPPASHKP